MKKFCTKCGHEFVAVGREVICPSCKATAAEESKRAAVERAKRASWNGESVPVRISGRASTVIRRYGAANGMPFAEALDALLKASTFFQTMGVDKWEEVEPYKSHRRDKHATESQDGTQTAQDEQEAKQDAPQEVKPQDAPQEVKKAAKVNKTVKTTRKAASTSKQAAGKGGKE